MSKFIKTFLLKFLLPVIIIIVILNSNILLGIISIIAYISFMLYSGRIRIYSYKGRMSYSRGDLNDAAQWFRKACETGKAKTETKVSYAYILLKSGNLEDSEKTLSSLLSSKLDKDTEMLVKSNLALVLWKKGSFDDALDMMDEVIKNYKTSTVYGTMGYFLILRGDLDRALEFNLEAYDYNSADAIITDNLGQTYYLRGEYDKASELYEKLIPTKPNFPSAYYNYGLLLFKQGKNEDAIDNMQKALNFKFSFLSTISKEEIEAKIEEIKRAS